MSLDTDNTLTFRTLYQSSLVRVRDYRCRACRGGPAAEEYSESNEIVLLRYGAFSKHFGRRSLTADSNHAVFFSKGSTYRVSHPAECGDRGTVFTPAPRVLHDILRERDPSIDDHPETLFPFVTSPCDASVFWQHRELVQRLEAVESNPLEPLWTDVTVLQLIADVLRTTFERSDLSPKRRRDGTTTDHANRVEAAKSYLASRFAERVMLEDVARAVHVSPFHLARIFQQRTGIPVHRYLTRLRLRASPEWLCDGAKDLTALALELGFSSHSHFTDVFRREFGLSPSQVRRDVGRRALREMSKKLEA